MGFLKSPEIPLEGLIKIPLERLIKIPLEDNFFRFPRESEKTRTGAVGFLKTPEIPLEGNFFRFPREAEKSRTKAVRFLKSTEIPLEGLIFHALHVADWPRVTVRGEVNEIATALPLRRVCPPETITCISKCTNNQGGQSKETTRDGRGSGANPSVVKMWSMLCHTHVFVV